MSYRVVVTAAAKQNLRAAYAWAAERAPQTALASIDSRSSSIRWRVFRNDAN